MDCVLFQAFVFYHRIFKQGIIFELTTWLATSIKFIEEKEMLYHKRKEIRLVSKQIDIFNSSHRYLHINYTISSNFLRLIIPHQEYKKNYRFVDLFEFIACAEDCEKMFSYFLGNMKGFHNYFPGIRIYFEITKKILKPKL